MRMKSIINVPIVTKWCVLPIYNQQKTTNLENRQRFFRQEVSSEKISLKIVKICRRNCGDIMNLKSMTNAQFILLEHLFIVEKDDR